MIQHVAFKHGWFYHYRVHTARAEQLVETFPQLHSYLHAMFKECPHEKFLSGPRSSKLRFAVPVRLQEIQGHPLCSMAAASLTFGGEKTPHTAVELGLLQADKHTISVEVPLWLDSHELHGYESLFDSTEALSGHIDILRVENNKIWIWDYKPGAHKERWAATQLNCYATMLATRTGVPLEHFMCGYFDEQTSFVFKPVPLLQS
jgi:hypothetical protein